MALLAARPRRPLALPLGKLAALGVGLLLALLLAEAGLRIVDLGHPYFSSPEAYQLSDNPRLLFELRPRFDGFTEGTRVITNSRGLRERELPLHKPPGVRRIVFLGDSVTFGSGVLAEEAFPRLVEGEIDAAGGGPIQTVNAAVVGYNTVQERALLEAVGLDYQPDAVVVTFLANDLLDSFSIFDHQYDPSGLLAGVKVWLRRNSHLYRVVQDSYWRIAQELRRPSEGPTEPLRKRERLEQRLGELAEIVRETRASGADVLLVLYPDNMSDPVSPGPAGERLTVREELQRFAVRENVRYVDLTEALGDVRDPRARRFRLREDPHPSPQGHRVIAEALRQPLLDLLAGR
ncbi:MAG: SGNH/GDSL hydrolase family protein [Chloroflexi bacterium]|nr:SGNH/GDSL hydrolase family protein [Chloroflexota bacterium]